MFVTMKARDVEGALTFWSHSAGRGSWLVPWGFLRRREHLGVNRSRAVRAHERYCLVALRAGASDWAGRAEGVDRVGSHDVDFTQVFTGMPILWEQGDQDRR
jgi:hypothetical protein